MTDELKITFAPGCFDSFDGTQEELDAMITEINKMFETGDFSSGSIEYLGENDLSDEEWDKLDDSNSEFMQSDRNLQ